MRLGEPNTRSGFVARADFVQGETMCLWRVATCPFCGKEHLFEGGLFGDDPNAGLAYRVSHCELKASDKWSTAQAFYLERGSERAWVLFVDENPQDTFACWARILGKRVTGRTHEGAIR